MAWNRGLRAYRLRPGFNVRLFMDVVENGNAAEQSALRR
jgi:hypothetical protein